MFFLDVNSFKEQRVLLVNIHTCLILCLGDDQGKDMDTKMYEIFEKVCTLKRSHAFERAFGCILVSGVRLPFASVTS